MPMTQVRNQPRLTGLDAAKIIIPNEGLQVSVEGIPGQIDGPPTTPRAKKLRLSQGVAHNRVAPLLAIVAHELATRCRTAMATPRSTSCAEQSSPP